MGARVSRIHQTRTALEKSEVRAAGACSERRNRAGCRKRRAATKATRPVVADRARAAVFRREARLRSSHPYLLIFLSSFLYLLPIVDAETGVGIAGRTSVGLEFHVRREPLRSAY